MLSAAKLLLPALFVLSLIFSGDASSSMCPINHVWNNGCVKLCTHPDFSRCGNVFPALYNPSFCALLRNGRWRSETYECAACKDNQVVGVLPGKCSCNLEPCPNGQRCINGACQTTSPVPHPPPTLNCSTILCITGFRCVYNKCVPQPGYCNSQSDCETYQFCLENKCADRCATIRCSNGFECSKGQCIPVTNQCRYPYDCPAGQKCNNQGRCVDKCDGVFCIATHRCVDGECVGLCENTGCSNGFRCYNGQCQPIQGYCSSTSQCRNTEICHMNRCTNYCSLTLCPPGTICQVNSCIPNNACQNSIQCPTGKYCRNGQCVTGCEAVTCPVGTNCNNGQCIPIEGYCYSNNQCRGGEVCNNGRCINQCALVLCSPGTVCTNGTCVWTGECQVDYQCSADKKCISARCVDRCANVLCPVGTICQLGQCVATNPCAAVSCIVGSQCQNGRCIPIYPTCFQSSDCPSNETCSANRCSDRCALIRCANGFICEFGQCINACSRMLCPVGTTCSEGKCVNNSPYCRTDSNCPSGLVCLNGVCVNGCSKVSCPSGSYCLNGECKLDLDVCPSDEDYSVTVCSGVRPNPNTCPTINYFVAPETNFCGVRNDGSRVSFVRGCEACMDSSIVYYFDAPCHKCPFVCRAGERCLGYYCSADQCRSDEECPYDWQTCVEGKCIDRCSLWKCASCKYGQCGYVVPYGQCRADGDCKNGWQCQNWKCVDLCWNVRCGQHYKCNRGQCIKGY